MCWISFLFMAVSAVAVHAAKTQDQSATFIQYLSQEKNRLDLSIQELQQQKLPTEESEFLDTKQRIHSMLMLNQAKIDSLNDFLEYQFKQQQDQTQKLKHLQQLPLGSGDPTVQAQVSVYTDLLSGNKITMDLIKDNLSTAGHFQDLLNQHIQKLDQWNQNFQLEKQLKGIKKAKEELNTELEILYKHNSDPIKPLDSSSIDVEAKTLINNQNIAFIQNALNALALQKNVVKVNQSLLKNADSKTLQHVIEVYDDAIDESGKLIESTLKIAKTLKSETILNASFDFKKSVKALEKRIGEQLKFLNETTQAWAQHLVDYRNQYKKLTSARQSLAEYRTNSWSNILKKIAAIPGLFYKASKSLTLKIYDSFRWLDNLHALLLCVILLMCMAFFLILNQFLKSLSSHKKRSRLTGYLYDGILRLIQSNIPLLCLLSMFMAVFYYTNMAYANYELFFNLFMIWIIFRSLILIARLGLLERISDYSGEDVKLYYRIKWLLLFGGWTAALMTFSHLLPLSILLQDIFNRLFMLFILTVSWVAWKSRVLILDVLSPLMRLKKRYIKNALSLLVILIPVTLFTTAVIGLSGFFNLAWIMSRYQAYILMILVGYILIRGLLFDALEFLSETMISSLHNGWLWIEVFLKPLDKILRLALLLLSLWLLFELFGLYADSALMLKFEKFFRYPIIHVTGIHITVQSVVEFLFLVALFYWIAKWTREFSYRWLYSNTTDPGIRNSLSVFTQYAVILFGGIITLHVLGFDLSGMSMVLGGLAVGMGFGLKDFANNIVGGMMLLIERPVREGDLISLGEFEGEVAHIGIRSMRVSTWDNTEVLIPNAETFNKPFINWTHQDGIVRTVVPIKVSRADDPVIVQQLILDVLAIIPEIVSNPPFEVFLKKIDEALIEFEVRYFINVQMHTRYAVRSKLLFAITAQFKAAGIRHPIDPITVKFEEECGDFFIPKDGSKDTI